MDQKTRSKKPSSRRSSSQRSKKSSDGTQLIPRAMTLADDDDVLLSGGSIHGLGFGRCGGRLLGSRVEQSLCDGLSRHGLAHSHSPRHFEVRLGETAVAAYAPQVVLRGRGREGKSVVIEASEAVDRAILDKIVAFRRQYGSEFYIIFVAPEEVLDRVALGAYDESCTTNDLDTLISRLAE